MNLTPQKREAIRMMFGGKCAYCGCVLPAKGFHLDHVEPVVRCYRYRGGVRELRRVVAPQNEHVDNLWPSCRACNINKSSMSLERWRKFLTDGPESLASYNGRFRHMLRFKIVTVNREPFRFWFEQFMEES